MKRMILKAGFLATLIAVFALGSTVIRQPASAQKPKPPATDCPAMTCPTHLSGWVYDGRCTTILGHDCVEECYVYRNTSTSQRCKNINNCAWQ